MIVKPITFKTPMEFNSHGNMGMPRFWMDSDKPSDDNRVESVFNNAFYVNVCYEYLKYTKLQNQCSNCYIKKFLNFNIIFIAGRFKEKKADITPCHFIAYRPLFTKCNHLSFFPKFQHLKKILQTFSSIELVILTPPPARMVREFPEIFLKRAFHASKNQYNRSTQN